MSSHETAFQSIYDKYEAHLVIPGGSDPIKYTYDWISNDLCGLLYRTRFGKLYLYELSQEEQEEYYSDYKCFEEYFVIDEDDLQMLKHSLLEQLEHFTPNQIQDFIENFNDDFD